MITFVYFLNTFVNFFYGVFLPIVPLLNEEYAGVAFSLYGASKILTYYVFGKLVDDGKIRTTLYITLLLFLLVPIFYLLVPAMPYIPKFIEGIAFAGGTVFCFTFMTIIATNKVEFEKQLKMIVILSSLGSLIGPLVGYYFISTDISNASYLFILMAIVVNGVALYYFKSMGTLDNKKTTVEFDDTRADKLNWNLVGMMLLLKGILMGIQPCIAYWCLSIFKFTPAISGLAYFVSGLGFVLGSLRPSFKSFYMPIISLVCIELSFTHFTFLFWPGLFMMSLWQGGAVVKCMLDLGWVTTDKTGHLNSLWLVISDIPLMITPALFWYFRDADSVVMRETLIGLMLVFIFIFAKRYQVVERNS